MENSIELTNTKQIQNGGKNMCHGMRKTLLKIGVDKEQGTLCEWASSKSLTV